MVGFSRATAALGLAVGLVWPSEVAAAWVESRVVRAAHHVALEPSGEATVSLTATVRVLGGPLKVFDIPGIDSDALPTELESTARAEGATDDSPALPAQLTFVPRDNGTQLLRLTFAPDAAPRKGTFTLVTHYRTNLRDRNLIQVRPEAADVSWNSPAWSDGFETPTVTFSVPRGLWAPRRPTQTSQPLYGFAPESAHVVEEKRLATGDLITLSRPYAPAQDRILWRIQIDPRIVSSPTVTTPALSTKPADAQAAHDPNGVTSSPLQEISARVEQLSRYREAGLLIILFAVAAELTKRRLRATVAASMPLLPVSINLLPWLAAALVTAGVGTQLRATSSTWGSLLVGAASLAVLTRPRFAQKAVRAPGQWLVYSPEPTSLRSRLRQRVDRRGLALLGAALAAHAVCVAATAPTSAYHAILFGLDAVFWLALFASPTTDPLGQRMLARAHRSLAPLLAAKHPAWRVVWKMHLPDGGSEPDELRLLVVPRAGQPAVRVIELGVGSRALWGHQHGSIELLARCDGASDRGAAFMDATAHLGAWSQGRGANERVLSIQPKWQRPANLASLVCAVIARAERIPTAAGASLSSAA